MNAAPLLRPTFTVSLALPRDEAVAAIRARFTRTPEMAGRWRGKGAWAELYLPESERRIWSPYLSVRVDPRADGSSLFGRFAPHPEVWTFFMFLYFLVAFVVLFGATLGYVQWASHEAAWGLWAIWIGVPALLAVHGASAVGARLGQAQMRRLRRELDDLLAGAPELGAVPD
ncbi:MAG TPA: hypothetical protein VJ997_00995 [Longimicrobiales bacterium]|nr:hypothetical protein [Longimicrobiales bacterium]